MPSMNRRQLLTAAAAAGVASTLGASPASAAPAQGWRAPGGRYRIDVHAHALPPAYRAALVAAGGTDAGGVVTPPWSPEAALDFMDRYGIQAQVLSISAPGVSFVEGQARVNLAAKTNDDLRAVVTSRPDRFGALAVLPLPDVAASVAEAVRALDVLKLDGIAVLSNYGGTYLADPALSPLWAELNKRKAYVFVHPETPLATDRPEQLPLPPALYEFPFDTTRALTGLLYAGVFRRFPDIRWQAAHSGGTLPFLASRLSLAALGTGPVPTTPAQFYAELRNLRYDTALSAARSAQLSLREVTGLDNIMFGTDWPFAASLYPASGDPQPALSDTYKRNERLQIERTNALREFPRLAAAQRSRDTRTAGTA
jgi:6-methylsalicylate decarboxylase